MPYLELMEGFQPHPYTDDTAMARGTAESLLRKKDFDAKDMAKTFAENYNKDTSRRYCIYSY